MEAFLFYADSIKIIFCPAVLRTIGQGLFFNARFLFLLP